MTSTYGYEPVLVGYGRIDLPWAAPAPGRARRAIRDWLRARRFSQDAIDDASLVASELVTDAVRHAEPRRDGVLRLNWELDGRSLRISADDGGSGLGLRVTELLARSCWHERDQHGVRVNALVGVA